MESTLSPDIPRASAGPRLVGLRRQFLAVDVSITGFLVFIIAWTLLSMVAPGARLYSYEPAYRWAEMPKLDLVWQLMAILCVYLALQRVGIHFHRRYTSTGQKPPAWKLMLNLFYVFSPVLLVPLVFNMLGAFIAGVSGVPGVHTHPSFDPAAHYDRAASYWDLWLKEADVTLTGVYPAEYFRQYQKPWLTGVMLLCYLSYYVSPLVAVLPQIVRRDWYLVRRCAAVYAGVLMVTYFGYMLIPATGPRFEGGFEAWLPAEPGWFGAEWWQRMLNDAEVIRWDAFPSGHVAIASVALVLALKHHRRVGLAYLPFVAGLPLATVFLGYHYVTDVLFGGIFAAVGMLALEPAARWWESAWHRPPAA